MSGHAMALIRRGLRKVAPYGVGPRLKLARLDLERRVFRRKIDHQEFRNALLSLGEWKDRPVWVQISLNDFYNVEMRPRDIIEMMLDLVGPRGTLIMPAFPLHPDPRKELQIDTAPSSTGLATEMFRRMPGTERSIHLNNSVVALGPDAKYLTDSHHLGKYPWGEHSPYGRLIDANGLMVGLGIVPLGFTPLHNVECVMHHLPVFEKVFTDEITYSWRRSSGETGIHTTFVRNGNIRTGRLVRHIPPNLLKRFRVSNLGFQSAPAYDTIDTLKQLAIRKKTIYVKF